MYLLPNTITLKVILSFQTDGPASWPHLTSGRSEHRNAFGNWTLDAEDLAELASDDLMEIIPMPEKQAALLIMTARAPWFEENNQQ